MSKACKIIPTVRNKKGIEVESNLFKTISNRLSSIGYDGGNIRNKTIELWGTVTSDGFKLKNREFLQYDENNEPTLESILFDDDINKVLNPDEASKSEQYNSGIIDKKGNHITYTSIYTALDKANTYNKSHKNGRYIATINQNGDNYSISLVYKNGTSESKFTNTMFSVSLNKQLLDLMHRLGFDVSRKELNGVNGIFNPLNAEKTKDGLLSIIDIAHGKKGEDAFPEEFSHLIIEGLKNTPLVQRILNSINSDEAIQYILGKDYDAYVELYNNDKTRLLSEAAAKILYSQIIGSPIQVPGVQSKNLIQRLWDYVKNLFSKTSYEDISNAIAIASQEAEVISDAIASNSILNLVDKELVKKSPIMYQVATATAKVNQLKDITEKAYTLAARKMKLYADKLNSGKYSIADLKTMKAMQENMEKEQYASGCAEFLSNTLSEIKRLRTRVFSVKSSTLPDTSMKVIREKSQVLNDTKDFLEAYGDIINTLKNLRYLKESGDVDINDTMLERIVTAAREVQDIMDELAIDYNQMKESTMINFLKQYWNGDIEVTNEKGEVTHLTLEAILDRASKDIGFVDSLFSSLGDANDELLSLLNKVYKVSRSKRDQKLEDFMVEMRALDKTLKNAGYTSDFMIERDSKGNKTGRFITHIPEYDDKGNMTGRRYSVNWEKFKQAKRDYIKSLRSQGLKWYDIQAKIETWENENTKFEYTDTKKIRKERLPIEKYRMPSSYNLTQAQLEYYDSVIALKGGLDNNLQSPYALVFNAPQIMDDTVEGIRNNLGNPAKLAKFIGSKVADNFVRRKDDTEFGMTNELGETQSIIAEGIDLDMSGNPVRQLPIYYTSRLGDMSRLSTDVTSTMMAYGGMAVHYDEMNNIIDVMELIRTHVNTSRDVAQLSGNSTLVETQKILGKAINTLYTKKGNQTNIGKRLDSWMESIFYGKRKLDAGTITLPFEVRGKKVEGDVAKLVDGMKSYSGLLGMGLNTFSAVSNVTVGKLQMWIEAAGSEFFGFKDMAVAAKEYDKMIGAYLGELYSTIKTNKMALLIDKFDALEEFYSNLKNKKTYTNAVSRIIGNTGAYVLTNMGEHLLHTRTMLAMLNRIKVNVGGVEMSMTDALEKSDIVRNGSTVGAKLFFKDGSVDSNGKTLFTSAMDKELTSLLNTNSNDRTAENNRRIEELKEIKEYTDNLITEIKMRIGKVNQSLNGAFNEDDKGEIHRHALGRLLMQFRQWMPAHYGRRFGAKRHDAILGDREGYYRTWGRFMVGMIKDLTRMKFQYATRKSQLKPYEIANLKKAWMEIGIFFLLMGMIKILGKPDDKDSWGEKQLKYQLRRMKLETGASCPVVLSKFWSNLLQLMHSPLPAVENVTPFIDLVEFWNETDEIQNGRYKGWTKWERKAFKATPFAPHFKNAFDFMHDDFMFKMYNE